MITIKCQCGEVYHASENQEGCRLKCHRCHKILAVKANVRNQGLKYCFVRNLFEAGKRRLAPVRDGLFITIAGAGAMLAGIAIMILIAGMAASTGLLVIVTLPAVLIVGGLIGMCHGLAEVGRGLKAGRQQRHTE